MEKRRILPVILVLASIGSGSCNKQGMTHPTGGGNKESAVSATNIVATPLLVFTLAGDTSEGFVDGIGAAARFRFLNGIAQDGSGNLFVADGFNRRIRRISLTGEVSTLTGRSDSTGFIATDGSLAEARFGVPAGLAFDGAGNLFVTDVASMRIREISGDLVTTVAGGTGDLRGGDPDKFNFRDGSGATATFFSPYGIAADGAGHLFIGDQGNSRLRRVDLGLNGIFSNFVFTFAGKNGGFADGQDTLAKFSIPSGVAMDNAGNIYVADLGNHCIRKVSPSRVVTTLAGNGTPGFVNGAGAAARFNSPVAVAVDGAGNVFVGDAGNFSIRKITPSGVVSTVAGNGVQGTADGTSAIARFTEIGGLLVDSRGTIYVTDRNRVRVITRPAVAPPPPIIP